MAFESRVPLNYFSGTLTTAAAISDTTLASSAFTALGTGYGTGLYLPLTLGDGTNYEVVWLTGHTAASSNATVVRGKEGTAARAWPAGTQILCAPTVRDGREVLLRSLLPSDAAYGETKVVVDEGITVIKTATAGWQAAVGVANPTDFGRRQDGSTIPVNSVILARGGRVTTNTNGSGQLAGTFEVPFPNQCLRAVPTWVSGGVTNFFSIGIASVSASGLTAYLYNGASGASATSGISVTFDYIAFGY